MKTLQDATTGANAGTMGPQAGGGDVDAREQSETLTVGHVSRSALPRPEGGKADLAGEERPVPEKKRLRWRDLCSAGAVAGALIGLFEASVYGIPWTWLRDHPATCGIQLAAGVFILVAALGWFVPPWRKFAWWSNLLIGLGLLILSRL